MTLPNPRALLIAAVAALAICAATLGIAYGLSSYFDTLPLAKRGVFLPFLAVIFSLLLAAAMTAHDPGGDGC